MKEQYWWVGLGSLIGLGLWLGGMSRAGEITDPVGDSYGYPDAISASARFANGNVYLAARFTEGSLDRTNLAFTFWFDRDQNPATGVKAPAIPLGADCSVTYNSATDLTRAMLGGVPLAWVPVNFESNSVSLVVPLSALYVENGVMAFALFVGIPFSTNGAFYVFDMVPDSANSSPLTDLTTPVPELKIQHGGSNVIVSWDARATDYTLESAPSLSPTTVWSPVTNEVSVMDGTASVTNSSLGQTKFYRMRL